MGNKKDRPRHLVQTVPALSLQQPEQAQGVGLDTRDAGGGRDGARVLVAEHTGAGQVLRQHVARPDGAVVGGPGLEGPVLAERGVEAVHQDDAVGVSQGDRRDDWSMGRRTYSRVVRVDDATSHLGWRRISDIVVFGEPAVCGSK